MRLLMLINSKVTLCSAHSNSGIVKGVGLYTGGTGTVLLRDATSMGGNRGKADQVYGNLYPEGGSIHYAFPIEAGSWLPNAVRLTHYSPAPNGALTHPCLSDMPRRSRTVRHRKSGGGSRVSRCL